LDIGYHFSSVDALFGLTVKDGLATVNVIHSRPLHVAVELVIIYQPALAGCFD
jgi:hypothetical protein